MHLAKIPSLRDVTNLTGDTEISPELVSSENDEQWTEERHNRRLGIWQAPGRAINFSKFQVNIALNTPSRHPLN